jgi:gliding motility-associated-like protein
MKLMPFFVILVLFPFSVFTQTTPSIEVTDSLGNTDILVDCDYPVDINRCFDLQANHTIINETTTYTVNSIPYVNLSGLTNETLVSIAADDKWSGVLQLPFDFCFFDENNTDFIIGDNGIISFDTNLALADSPYSAGSLPNGSMPTNAIYGAFHDLTNDNNVFGCTDDPNTGVNECGEIKTYIIGTAPQRAFVISYENINHFNCENVRSTLQIVLYEVSNVIEVYIQDKPINCEADPNHFRKNALIGIQNQDGSIANTPPGRNTSVWSTSNEAWQFLPNGVPATIVNWEDENGVNIGTGNQIMVCPEQTTTYTAIVTYTKCDGTTLDLQDTINVAIALEIPVAIDNTIAVCDLNVIGEELVDLTTYESLMLGTQVGLVVSYFNSLADAQNDVNAIVDPQNYLLNNPTETIFVRLVRGIDCFDVGQLILNLEELGTSQIPDITICDLANDNSENIVLTNYNSQILGAQSGYVLTYFLSQNDADNNVNPQTQITAADGDSFFVRFTVQPNQACPNVDEITINLIPAPNVTPVDTSICSNILTYDLTQHEAAAQGNNTETVTFSYFLSQANAINNISPIDPANLANYQLNGIATIWVRNEVPNGCTDIFPINFTYIQGVAATDDTQVSLGHDFNLEDSLPDMAADLTDIVVTYFDENGVQILDPINYTTINDREDITVVFTNTVSGCISTAIIHLATVDFTGITDPDYLVCDSNNDVTELVTLNIYDPQLIVGLDDAQFMTVSYYITNADATNAVNPITDITITGPTTIFARISLNDEDDIELDFMVVAINLSFQATPQLTADTTSICDEGSDNQEIYDITQHEAIIGGGVAGLIFTYTDSNNDVIVDPTIFTVIGPTSVVNVFVTAANGCFSQTTLTISFNGIPSNDVVVEQCDADGNNQETFDLDLSLPNVSANHASYVISYYTTRADAEIGNLATAIPNPNTYLINADTIVFVRLFDNALSCYTVAQMDLVIIDLPQLMVNTISSICDFGNDNIENNVVLSQFDANILGAQTGVTVAYYVSNADATAETNVITDFNIANNTTIFVRLSAADNCDTIGSVIFNLQAAPTVTNINVDVCDSFNDNQETYNLRSENANLVTNTALYSFQYFNTQQDAIDNVNVIAQPNIYVINTVPQTVFVRVTDNVTGCFSVAEMAIDFNQPAIIQDTELSSCDDDFNLSEEFDLSEALPAMVANPNDFTITYYSNETAAQTADVTFEIVTPQNHNTASETDIVFVRFVDPLTGCFSIGRIVLRVLATPKLINSSFSICDTDFDGQFTLDLSDLNPLIIQDQTNLVFTYYTSFANAENETNAIVNTTNYAIPGNNHTVFIRVINTLGCWSIASVNISILESATVLVVNDILEACDDDLDDFAIFDLTTFASLFTAEVGATFRYYNNNIDANLEANEIITPTTHQNIAPNTQTIFVRVSVPNKCDALTQFTINTIHITAPNIPDDSFCAGTSVTLDAGASYVTYNWSNGDTTQITDITVAGTYTVTLTDSNGCSGTYSVIITEIPLPPAIDTNVSRCDDDGINDERLQFDLTDYIADVTNNTANLTTEFYLNQTDLDNGITLNTIFTNTVNPQTILVRVQDNTTLCFDVAELTLSVDVIEPNDVTVDACDDLNSEDGINDFNLALVSPDVVAGLVSGLTVSYYLSFAEADTATNPLGNSYTNTTPYTQIIFARAENSMGCYGISEITLSIHELPDIVIEEDQIYCTNTYPDTIELTGGILTNPEDYTYLWSTGETTANIQINEAGLYTVEVTSTDNCSRTREIFVEPSSIATIDSIIIGNLSEINNVTVFAEGIGDYEYAIDDINGPYQDDNVFFNVLRGVHTIYVRDKNGCGVTPETITSVIFPKFFTPNNDNAYDTWIPIGLSSDIHSNISIFIFDRYGKVLKELDPFGDGWNGIYIGKLMPNNDYWYKVSFTENFSHKQRVINGHFTLKTYK